MANIVQASMTDSRRQSKTRKHLRAFIRVMVRPIIQRPFSKPASCSPPDDQCAPRCPNCAPMAALLRSNGMPAILEHRGAIIAAEHGCSPWHSLWPRGLTTARLEERSQMCGVSELFLDRQLLAQIRRCRHAFGQTLHQRSRSRVPISHRFRILPGCPHAYEARCRPSPTPHCLSGSFHCKAAEQPAHPGHQYVR